jgi:hypothetical protein
VGFLSKYVFVKANWLIVCYGYYDYKIKIKIGKLMPISKQKQKNYSYEKLCKNVWRGK